MSWPAPEPCTETPSWWNPRCLQTEYWGRDEEEQKQNTVNPRSWEIKTYEADSVWFSYTSAIYYCIMLLSGQMTLREEGCLTLKHLCVCARGTECTVFAQCCNWMCAEAFHLWGLSYLGCWWLSIPSLVLISLHSAKPLYRLLTLWARSNMCVFLCLCVHQCELAILRMNLWYDFVYFLFILWD